MSYIVLKPKDVLEITDIRMLSSMALPLLLGSAVPLAVFIAKATRRVKREMQAFIPSLLIRGTVAYASLPRYDDFTPWCSDPS